MKDQTDNRPPWWETILMKDQTDDRPPWWKTKLTRDHTDERPNWCENTLLKDQTDVRTPCWKTTLIWEHPNKTTQMRNDPEERPSWHESTLIRPPRWATTLMWDHRSSNTSFLKQCHTYFLNKPTRTKVHLSLKIGAWSLGSEVITKWNIPTWNKHANGKSSSRKTVRFTSGGSRCSEQSALAATCSGGTPPVWTASLWRSRTVGQAASPQFHCRKRSENEWTHNEQCTWS